MRIGVLGTGMVGEALATKLVELGHEVMMGARQPDNPKATAWAEAHGDKASHGDFAATARFCDLAIIACKGGAVLDVADATGGGLDGKTVIDVTNPLSDAPLDGETLLPQFSRGTSAAEQLQARLPRAHVVKTLNTMNCKLMVDPHRVPGDHDVFVSSNDANAKAETIGLLGELGWPQPIDLGPLSTARGVEGLMGFWLAMMRATGSSDFNYKIARA